MDSPRERSLRQAALCREQWCALDEARRERLIARLREEDHPIGRVWIEVLEGRHPLAAWLDGPSDGLPSWPGAPSPRQLFSSHPFSERPPWSTPPTSRPSSSTRRG